MLRLSSLALAFLALLALPTAGRAADPLLSGYGGPGGGQQVLLGSHLLGGYGHGSGGAGGAPASLRAPAPAHAPAGTSTPATGMSGTGTPQGTGTAADPSAGGAMPAQPAGSSGHAEQQPGHGTQRGTQATAAPRRVAYPARTDDAGGFPLSAGDVVAGLLVLLAAAGMGVWMRRTVTRDGDGPQAVT